MSVIQKYKCDHCGTEARERKNEKGWIVLSISDKATPQGLYAYISSGKYNKSAGEKEVITKRAPQRMDFCDESCMCEYFKQLVRYT